MVTVAVELTPFSVSVYVNWNVPRFEARRWVPLVPAPVRVTRKAPFVQTVLPEIPGVAAVPALPPWQVTARVPAPLPEVRTGAEASWAARPAAPVGRSFTSRPEPEP